MFDLFNLNIATAMTLFRFLNRRLFIDKNELPAMTLFRFLNRQEKRKVITQLPDLYIQKKEW